MSRPKVSSTSYFPLSNGSHAYRETVNSSGIVMSLRNNAKILIEELSDSGADEDDFEPSEEYQKRMELKTRSKTVLGHRSFKVGNVRFVESEESYRRKKIEILSDMEFATISAIAKESMDQIKKEEDDKTRQVIKEAEIELLNSSREKSHKNKQKAAKAESENLVKHHNQIKDITNSEDVDRFLIEDEEKKFRIELTGLAAQAEAEQLLKKSQNKGRNGK
jgi:hypothetical protein